MYADIKEIISLDEVMEERKLGPNGALIYCMEYPSYSKYFLLSPLVVYLIVVCLVLYVTTYQYKEEPKKYCFLCNWTNVYP